MHQPGVRSNGEFCINVNGARLRDTSPCVLMAVDDTHIVGKNPRLSRHILRPAYTASVAPVL